MRTHHSSLFFVRGAAVVQCALHLLTACLCGLLCLSSHAQVPDGWQPVQRLRGDWTGTSEGQAGSGTVSRNYAQVIGRRFIQEQNTSTYPPQEQNKAGEVHEHWGMFSYDKARKVLVLRHFHVEGFVNTYRQLRDAEGADRLVFESENFENFSNSWKARETYEFLGDDAFVETF